MAENRLPEDLVTYIDVDTALSRMRGNKKLYRRMLTLFQQSKEFAAFEEHLAANDITKAGEVAHAIKGMVGNLTMPALFEESTRLMNQMRTGERDEPTIEKYREVLKKTQEYVELLAASIDAENA